MLVDLFVDACVDELKNDFMEELKNDFMEDFSLWTLVWIDLYMRLNQIVKKSESIERDCRSHRVQAIAEKNASNFVKPSLKVLDISHRRSETIVCVYKFFNEFDR